jgi:RNA polymerase sigma-70 factor (ECF subfamily)
MSGQRRGDGVRVTADDGPLFDRAKTDPSGAFAELYRRWSGPLLGAMTRRCGGDLQRAEDICQSTWAKAWVALPRYEHAGRQYLAYLLTIATNTLLDDRKSRWSRCVRVLDPLPESHLPSSPAPEHDAQESARAHRVAALAAELGPVVTTEAGSEQQGRVIALRYLAGLPVATVAQTLGMTEPAVKSATVRGLRQLRKSDSIRRVYDELKDLERA